MLVVKLEVWPGGDWTRGRTIGEVQIANVSGLAQVSDYDVEVRVDEATVPLPCPGRRVRGHCRADGAWALVAKALAALGVRGEAGRLMRRAEELEIRSWLASRDEFRKTQEHRVTDDERIARTLLAEVERLRAAGDDLLTFLADMQGDGRVPLFIKRIAGRLREKHEALVDGDDS